MSIISNNDNDNDNDSENSPYDYDNDYDYDMSGVCSMCGKYKRFIERNVKVYYQSGNKMRLENFCFDPSASNNDSTVFSILSQQYHTDNCCFHTYYSELGFGLTIAGFEEKVYHTIRSIFISCPLLPDL